MLKSDSAWCILAIVLISILVAKTIPPVEGWSNGGYSDDPNNPDYGTHDFLARHALDWVPEELDFWLQNNLAIYLYGTELPDNANAPLGDGIGDTTKHHVYYRADGSLQDEASALRAKESYDQTLAYLAVGDYWNASKWMGITSHYVSDVSVFGHVMGAGTDWGAETHHSDYENWVNSQTNRYDAPFTSCLSFDGKLEFLTAYDATLRIAYDTTFDSKSHGFTAKWMDDNYNPTSPTFQMRVCESINLSVNLLADVIHTISVTVGIPEWPQPALIAGIALALVVALRGKLRLAYGRPSSHCRAANFHRGKISVKTPCLRHSAFGRIGSMQVPHSSLGPSDHHGRVAVQARQHFGVI